MVVLDKVKFFLERQLVKGAHFQLLAMLIVVVILAVVGGILVLDTDPDANLGDSIWWAFLRLSDPGYLGDDEGTFRRIVATVLTLGGYVVVVGMLVAILTRWLIELIRRLEQGLTPVTIKNHIVVLGWTDRTQAILREMLVAGSKVQAFLAARGLGKRVVVVILTEDISSEITNSLRVDKSLRNRIGDVILRSGSALKVSHLRRVAAENAAAVILPAQVFDEDQVVKTDVQTIKKLLSLSGLIRDGQGSTPPLVVAEIQDSRKISLARRAYKGPMEVIVGDRAISRMMVQTFLHPGLSGVYNELLSTGEGNEIFIKSYQELGKKTVWEARRYFPRGIFCGVIRTVEGKMIPYLNPGADFLIEEGDAAVLICDTEANARPGTAATGGGKDEVDSPAGVVANQKALKLLILGWSSKARVLIEELLSYSMESLEVTIISTVPVDHRRARLREYLGDNSGDFCNQIEADFAIKAELRAVDPAGFDQILFLSSDRMENGDDADARTLMGYLSLEEILEEVKSPPQILIELADENNRTLLGPRSGEMIISPSILSHILAQVAMRRELRVVLEELFTVGGAEFLFRKYSEYDLRPGLWSFADLQKEAWRHGEILVGVGKEINPPREKTWELGGEQGLIVIATMEQV